MASPSKVSILMAILFSSIFLPSFHEAAPTWSSQMVEQVCDMNNAENWSKPFCIQTLQSDNRIVSATNLFSLAIGIIESGISNATTTHAYLKDTLRAHRLVTPPNSTRNIQEYNKTLHECTEFYDGAITSFQSALVEVKDEKEYETSSYDVLIAADDVNNCEQALVSGKADFPSVSSGNKVVRYIALAADKVVTRLWVASPPYPNN